MKKIFQLMIKGMGAALIDPIVLFWILTIFTIGMIWLIGELTFRYWKDYSTDFLIGVLKCLS